MGIELFKTDKEGIPLVSPSQINLLMTCGAKWKYKYVQKMKDPMGIDSSIGNFVHEALELGLQAHMEGKTIKSEDVYLSAFEGALLFFGDPEKVKDLRNNEASEAVSNADHYAKLCGNLASVAWRWFESSGLTVVSVERSLERTFDYKGHKMKVGGRLDLLAKDKDGNHVIIDWKTAGKAPYKDAKGGYVMDRPHANQQLIYARCLQEQGIEVKRVGTLKVTKTKVPAAYFSHVDVTPGMLMWSQSIVEAAIGMVYNDVLAPNPIGAGPLCAKKYCFAYDICPGSSRHVVDADADEP